MSGMEETTKKSLLDKWVWAVLAAMKRSFPELFTVIGGRTLPMVCGIVLVSGVLLCVISTYFVVNKLVAASKDDLYY